MKQISKEYAEAIFSLACETGEEEHVMAALETVMRVLRDAPEYMELISSPSVPVNERVHMIGESFGMMAPECVVSLMQLMCEKGRIRALGECVAEYRRLLDVKRAAMTAHVTSAVELTADEREALVAKLEAVSGHTVTLACTVDASLLGGMIVEMDGRVTDGSLRHRLQEVKEVMNT